MSIQKICRYTEILENSNKIQNPTDYDRARISVIQNSAISGIIESGAPFSIKEGNVILEFESGLVSVPIANLYPYLSPKYQTYFSSATNNIKNTQTNSALETYDSNSSKTVEPQAAPQETQPQNTQPKNTSATNNAPNSSASSPVATPEPTHAAPSAPTPEPAQNAPTPQNNDTSVKEDVITLNKADITYERCNLELVHSNGSSIVFSVHSAPLFDLNRGEIIVRLKLLGNNGSYMHTECGNNITFVYNNIQIFATREATPDGSFSCKYWCNDPNIKVNKLNIEKGGNKGNLVIYDNNLELRIYPFPNIRDKAAGKMVFGNNKNGEAAFLYYMNVYGNILASSGSERKPEFIYDNANLKLTAKWKDNTIAFTAVENN